VAAVGLDPDADPSFRNIRGVSGEKNAPAFGAGAAVKAVKFGKNHMVDFGKYGRHPAKSSHSE
jgi:hypothetical protein